MRARFVPLVVAAVAICACHDAPRDAAPAPPITAAKPAESEPANAAPTPQPEPAPAPAQKAAVNPPAAATATATATPQDTSLPGAIPPSPLPDPNAKPADKPADPLKWLQDSQARQADYKRRLEEAETNVASADTAAAAWEKNVLAFKNPFLPRPVLTPDDAAAIKGMDGVQRVKWAEEKLATARAARDDAKKALDDLKANPPLN